MISTHTNYTTPADPKKIDKPSRATAWDSHLLSAAVYALGAATGLIAAILSRLSHPHIQPKSSEDALTGAADTNGHSLDKPSKRVPYRLIEPDPSTEIDGIKTKLR